MPSCWELLLYLVLLLTYLQKVKLVCVYEDISDNVAIIDGTKIYCFNVPESHRIGDVACTFRVKNGSSINFNTNGPLWAYTTLASSHDDGSLIVKVVQRVSYSELVDRATPPNASTIYSRITCVQGSSHYSDLYVDIDAKNTQKPVFLDTHYFYTVTETWPVGVDISINQFGTPILAQDRDNSFGNMETIASEIIFEIQNGSEHFTVTTVKNISNPWPYTYHAAISAKKAFDYQIQSSFEFTLIAKNADGNTAQRSAVKVIVKLQDFDNLDPIFTSSYYSTSVEETLLTTPGTYNLTTNPGIEAYDQDTGINQELTYSINTDCASSPYCDIVKTHFKINNKTGELAFISNGSWPYDDASISFLILARQTDDLDKVATSEVIATFELPAANVQADNHTN